MQKDFPMIALYYTFIFKTNYRRKHILENSNGLDLTLVLFKFDFDLKMNQNIPRNSRYLTYMCNKIFKFLASCLIYKDFFNKSFFRCHFNEKHFL